MSAQTGEYYWVNGSDQRELLSTQYGPEEHNQMNQNAFGLLMYRDKNYPDGCPVICGHGGSMWLCAKCAQEIIESQGKVIISPP